MAGYVSFATSLHAAPFLGQVERLHGGATFPLFRMIVFLQSCAVCAYLPVNGAFSPTLQIILRLLVRVLGRAKSESSAIRSTWLDSTCPAIHGPPLHLNARRLE